MILIWKGAGILVPIITIGLLLVTEALLGVALPRADPQALNLLGNGVALGLCVPLFVVLNVRLDAEDAPDPEFLPIDPRTGKRERWASMHTFFWIPMKYWAIPIAALSLSFLLRFTTYAMAY